MLGGGGGGGNQQFNNSIWFSAIFKFFRINAFIEEEVQRRLQNIHGTSGANNNSLLQTTELVKVSLL